MKPNNIQVSGDVRAKKDEPNPSSGDEKPLLNMETPQGLEGLQECKYREFTTRRKHLGTFKNREERRQKIATKASGFDQREEEKWWLVYGGRESEKTERYFAPRSRD